MSVKNDWNPSLYLKFKNERTQPSIDLISRINVSNPKTIIDIGCGPGNSTAILLQKWPNSKITGIDNSVSMIEKAKTDYPDQFWQVQDASQMSKSEKYDIVFSNAAIQWIPQHEKLILNFVETINDAGALAIQVPLYNEMPICEIIDNAYKKLKNHKQVDYNTIFTFHDRDFYYDILSDNMKKIDMWETSYIHIMNSCKDILEMIKSTGMKLYLENIDNDEEKIQFENDVLSEISKEYMSRKDNNVLFPFKRLFWIAYK